MKNAEIQSPFRLMAHPGATRFAFFLALLAAFAVSEVQAQDHPPVAAGGRFETDQDVALSGHVSGYDADNDPITYVILTAPVHGTLPAISSTGDFVYTPAAGFHGTDSFVFAAKAAGIQSVPETVLLVINGRPVAESIAITIPPNQSFIGRLRGSDPDGDSLAYALVAGSASIGNVGVDIDGRFTFPASPSGGTFQYTVSDGRTTSTPASVTLATQTDDVGYIGDLQLPLVTRASIQSGTGIANFNQVDLPTFDPAVDMAVDRVNRRLYVLTPFALQVYDIVPESTGTPLNYVTSVPVFGTRLALSLDGRTVFIGGIGSVTAINLYPEGTMSKGGFLFKAKPEMVPAYQNWRVYNYKPSDRPVAAMAVHPAGNRLFVVLGMRDSDKKLPLPADFGYITQLDISSEVQTIATKAKPPEFAPAINLKDLVYPNTGTSAIGVNSLTFSPDGNCAFLAAVGAQTSRATPFGILPSPDEGTGGIVVLDVRPLSDSNQPWVNYLGLIPTTEHGENTAELRRQIQVQGWLIVHPAVQWARDNLLAALGQVDVSLSSHNYVTTAGAAVELAVDNLVLSLLERSYADYGPMQAYAMLYPHDMVGATSVAVNHAGDFGVVTMRDTNNLGLLSLAQSADVAGYSSDSQPNFFIKSGTGKTVNDFDAAGTFLGVGLNSTQPSLWNWAAPQRAVFTSDDSRLYIGMAGGVPRFDNTNKFGSVDGYALRTRWSQDVNPNNLAPGYSLYGGTGVLSLRSPRLAATWPGFGSGFDLLSDQTKAYNRWNALRSFNDDTKKKLISTDAAHLSIPGRPTPYTSGLPDALDFGYLLPTSGIGYRMNLFGLRNDSGTFVTKGVVTTIERLGQKWDELYHAYLSSGTPDVTFPVTRPYFILGPLTRPGGGRLMNALNEAMTYTQGNGLQASFPYFTVGSDVAHDFVRSNGPSHPRDNSKETASHFDLNNTKAMIKLLLDQPEVRRIELDPYVIYKIPDLANESRVIPHGSREDKNSRRDLDNHMFVTFDLAVQLDIDADNSGAIDQTPAERGVSNQPGTTGKLILANSGDQDGDGIPNFADGYDLFSGQASSFASADFTPMVIHIPVDLDLAGLQFKVTYSESDPALVERSTTQPYTYSLPSNGGAFRVWTKDGGQARHMAQVSAGGDYIAPNVTYPISALNFDASRTATVYIEAVGPLRPGEKNEVTFELILSGGAQSSVTSLSNKVAVLPVVGSLAVDNDRDGTIKLITESNSDLTSVGNPFRFWINDDTDSGDTGGNDVPDQEIHFISYGEYTPADVDFAHSPDYATALLEPYAGQGQVHGTRDLVDYFPVYLDIKQLLKLFPPDNSIKYKLKQADSALNFVYTKLTRSQAEEYQTRDMGAIFGSTLDHAAGAADKRIVTADGIDLFALPNGFADWILNHDGGVILLDGRKTTTSPLVLSVEKSDGTVLAALKLDLSISGVEKMFRHVNLCYAAGEENKVKSRATAPNMPDYLTNGKNFVFVHGYNVNQEQARGWESETFKRMWWSRSKAKFYGVTWRGADTQVANTFTVNYEINVVHAFQTAPALAGFLNNLQGEVTTCAHSLGNMLVLAAANPPPTSAGGWAFPAANNIARHMAFDAAVAAEAIDPAAPERNEMLNSLWTDRNGDHYHRTLRATEWYTNFPTDYRSHLTWRGRLALNPGHTPEIFNFYSDGRTRAGKSIALDNSESPGDLEYGEEVLNYRNDFKEGISTQINFSYDELKNLVSPLGNDSWYYQELLKGLMGTLYESDWSNTIAGFGGILTGGKTILSSEYGGWGFGLSYEGYIFPIPQPGGGTVPGYHVPPDPSALPPTPWTLTMLQHQPLFLYGTFEQISSSVGGPTEPVADLYGPDGAAFAERHLASLLAEMIPATTVPMGREPVSILGPDHNFDLSSDLADNGIQDGWPAERINDLKEQRRWRHSDGRNVAFKYNHRLFEIWVERAHLDTP